MLNPSVPDNILRIHTHDIVDNELIYIANVVENEDELHAFNSEFIHSNADTAIKKYWQRLTDDVLFPPSEFDFWEIIAQYNDFSLFAIGCKNSLGKQVHIVTKEELLKLDHGKQKFIEYKKKLEESEND